MPCCKQDSLCSHSFGNILFEAIRHAVKALAEISEKIKLLPPSITDSISALKTEILNEKTISLDVEEALIALSISAAMTKDERNAASGLITRPSSMDFAPPRVGACSSTIGARGGVDEQRRPSS